MDPIEVGKRIREYREGRAQSREDLAARIGMHVNTLHGVENGMHKPRPSTIRKIAEGLEIEVEDLTGATPPKVEAPPSPARRSPEEQRRVDYLAGFEELVRSAEARLQEAITTGDADFGMVRQTADLHEDLHRVAVEKIGLLRGLEDMPEEEAEARDRIATALDDLRSTVDEGYDEAIKKLRDQKAEVESLGQLRQQGAAEEGRARSA